MAPVTDSAVQEISVDEFDEFIENHESLVIVDMRTPAAHARARIPRSLNLPFGSLESAGDLPAALTEGRGKTIVVYCEDGNTSRRAVALLQARGFERVYCLAGGLARWRAAGQAVIAD